MVTPLFSGLILPNSTVRVWGQSAVTTDDAGGQVEQYSTLIATGVPVLVSQVSGDRDGSFGTRLNRATGTISGDDPSLASQKTRIEFLTGDAELIGLVAEVRSISDHRPSPDGWVPRRITIRWSQIGYAGDA